MVPATLFALLGFTAGLAVVEIFLWDSVLKPLFMAWVVASSVALVLGAYLGGRRAQFANKLLMNLGDLASAAHARRSRASGDDPPRDPEGFGRWIFDEMQDAASDIFSEWRFVDEDLDASDPRSRAGGTPPSDVHGPSERQPNRASSLNRGARIIDRLRYPRGATGGLVTILFTDMAGSTATTQRLGDNAAHDLVWRHNSTVRDALAHCGGQEIKHTGDGIMASFPSAVAVVDAAVDIQLGLREQQGGADKVSVRIGLNAGEPIVEGDDLFGTAVQLASRILDQATPGQILVSDVVRQLVAGKNFSFEEQDRAIPRGFDEPVRLFAVQWEN